MILIVDDKAENLFSLRRTLEINGFEVDSADSGEAALKKILNSTYSLIILDVQMPGMDGFEVAEAISGYSKAKDIPIIFLSAVNTDKKFITKGYTSGGVDYVTKPVDPDIFLLKVKTLNRLYEQNRELGKIQMALLEEVEVRKKAEEGLNKSVNELRSILEAMPQVAFTIKPNGEIEYVNQQWFIYSREANVMPEVTPGDEGTWDRMREAMAAQRSFLAEVRMRNLLSGQFRCHLLKLIPVWQGDEVAKWVGSFTDIQEQKAANEILEAKVKERTIELLTKNKELESSNHELQQFASVASHDLKEPLRKIQVFSSIIKDKLIAKVPEARDKMDRIIEASQRMSVLINDLLDYSRLSVRSLFRPTDLNKLVNEIVEDLEFTISEKQAVVTISDMPVIDAIPGQLRQVFQNLVTNSLKFARKDVVPVIHIFAEVVSIDGEDYCRVTVKDNGIGFDEKYLEKIFTMFQRLNSAEAYEGTGIGLAIVKKIMEKHNGYITAESHEDEGAAFIMTLPLHQVENMEQAFTEM
ncbi:MAG: response regulator [Taibaiella sp.]|nr:response regulator [Taibaiella sp.]